MVFRVGRKVKRTVYIQVGDEPGECGSDRLIGMLDTPELAAFFVEAANAKLAAQPDFVEILADSLKRS